MRCRRFICDKTDPSLPSGMQGLVKKSQAIDDDSSVYECSEWGSPGPTAGGLHRDWEIREDSLEEVVSAVGPGG